MYWHGLGRVRLLAVNSYDKDAYVRRWIDDARELDPTWWRLQVINSGPTREFPDAWTVPAANPSAIEGYRLSLSATVIDHDVDAIVSVHSKTHLTSLGLLDHVADRLPGHDAVFMERPPCFDDIGGGEHLFLFAVRADRWRELTEAISTAETGLWNEVAMARAVDAIGLDVYRMSARHRRTPTEHNSTSNPSGHLTYPTIWPQGFAAGTFSGVAPAATACLKATGTSSVTSAISIPKGKMEASVLISMQK